MSRPGERSDRRSADFTCSLLLGTRNSGPEQTWRRLTTGRPAALEEPPGAAALARRVAAAQGAQRGVVHRTALHGLLDVVALLVGDGGVGVSGAGVVALDAGTYPLGRAAAWAGAAGRVPVVTFAHHDAADLAARLRRLPQRPVILTDGWCTGCGQPAPLEALQQLAAWCGGVLVVDDSQAFGLLGARSAGDGFGSGGGGTGRWLGIERGTAVCVASLAKAYGAPLAVTTAPSALVERLSDHGTRSAASPPTAADLSAGLRATADETGSGHGGTGNDRRRAALFRLVGRLREGLAGLGLPALGQAFPVVPVPVERPDAVRLHRHLGRYGVRAAFVQPMCRPCPALAFVLTAAHAVRDVDLVLDVLAQAPRLLRWGA